MKSASKARSALCGGVLIFLLVSATSVRAQAVAPTWTQLRPTGGPPSARAEHSGVYDPTSNRMIVFGGQAGFRFFNDVWILANANGLGGTPMWTQLNPTGGPPVRDMGVAAYTMQLPAG